MYNSTMQDDELELWLPRDTDTHILYDTAQLSHDCLDDYLQGFEIDDLLDNTLQSVQHHSEALYNGPSIHAALSNSVKQEEPEYDQGLIRQMLIEQEAGQQEAGEQEAIMQEESVRTRVGIEEYQLVLDKEESKRLEHRFIEMALARGGGVTMEEIDYSGDGKQLAVEGRRMVYMREGRHFHLCGLTVVVTPRKPGSVPDMEDIHTSFNEVARDVKLAVQQCGKEKRAHDMSRSDYSNDVTNMMLQAGLMTGTTKRKGDNLINDFKASMYLDERDRQYKVALKYCQEAVAKYKQITDKARERSQKRRDAKRNEQEERGGKRARAALDREM
ncbi:hypothetical protein GUITHDRAFT_118343 [Guillardia theta CCMP2712]|uniref:Uncharacterized protein n=1 Tax=Guillardia theta (strain CCMP2712) TaxID=905079 RepID=L1IH20_GUITC|nr:hypothetical protein GUITHDRAFT_118343 [Guillardia theta CCMP2712]EKX35533.1 hypothetical protein GUITHDRAFT_118343 [Guillardia theta CCMP2712]|eukprot:XP_005822513.1 hypothetical protein GUITHDRAFT_118343 [Guillardia theta CCMP2712]